MAPKAAPAMQCARCFSTQHVTSQCSYSFYRQTCSKCNSACREVKPGGPVCRFQRELDELAWQWQKEQRRAEEENKRAARRDSNKTDREVARLLDKENAERASIKAALLDGAGFEDSVSSDIVTDGAGVEWKWDEKTRWWWWLDAHGDWQGRGLSWTPLPKKKDEKVVVATFPRKNAVKRGAGRQSNASDAASESAASSVATAASTVATATRPKKDEKVVVATFPRKNEAKRGARRQSNASDTASESAASSVSTAASTAATATRVKKDEKVVVETQRPCALEKPLTVVAALAPAPASPVHAEHSSAEVSSKPEGQSLSCMVATIRGELGLDDALTVAQVIAEANRQLGMPAEGNFAKQASSLLREIV